MGAWGYLPFPGQMLERILPHRVPRMFIHTFFTPPPPQIGGIFRAAFASAPGGGAARVRVVLGGWGHLCGGYCGERVLRESLGWNGTAAKVLYEQWGSALCGVRLGSRLPLVPVAAIWLHH